jgi:hypothetical protein
MNKTETANNGSNATVTETVTQWPTRKEFDELVNQVRELQRAIPLLKQDEFALRTRVFDLEDDDTMDNQVDVFEKRITELESKVEDLELFGLES